MCHKKQSQFNKDKVEFDILNDFEKYGLNTLHCGINAVNGILKIASQRDIRMHRVAGEQNKLKKQIRAARNAQKLWDELEISVQGYYNVTGILKSIRYDQFCNILKILKNIQQILKSKLMSLYFNIPFTTGNCARIFFENYEKVAKILQLPEFLIKDLGIMWETIRSGLPIDADKFGDFCDLFVTKFNADPLINWLDTANDELRR